MKPDPDKGAVIVTGSGSGIGYALTLLLLKAGYHVSACDVAVGKLVETAHPLLSFYKLDVREKTEMDKVVEETIIRSGRVDGLVTCAAVFPGVPFLELNESTWDSTFDINLKGSFLACQAVLPVMRKQRQGNMVLFSSSLARTGAINGAHYAATKGGILGFARSLALEVAKENIRVNVVSPGITDTPQPRGNISEEAMYERGKTIPLKRIGSPEDMAEAALFLLQEESSFITGQDLRINGGVLMF